MERINKSQTDTDINYLVPAFLSTSARETSKQMKKRTSVNNTAVIESLKKSWQGKPPFQVLTLLV